MEGLDHRSSMEGREELVGEVSCRRKLSGKV